MPGADPCWLLRKYINFALWIAGSAFTVHKAESSPGSSHVVATRPRGPTQVQTRDSAHILMVAELPASIANLSTLTHENSGPHTKGGWKKSSEPLLLDFQSPKKAKKKEAASSNVFSMFEQSQIQEFKEAFTIMDQNRDGFIDKNDLRDTFAALGRLNVGNDELDEMLKEASGPINFTVFLTMFGEKLKGKDQMYQN
ncbi:hypothetical protein cypCar_00006221 [Cyprinus carpio]|nr:hypothetical protein cypCar_00006221 [Cyprinus carpio]